MTHGSLFSGIGGFDLAADWMGWENLFHCEWNEFGQKVLNYYWPDAELFTDITKSDFTKYANRIDVLSGGFPCQPYSHAGKRLGKEDERHLWPEMLRAIREIQPTWVVGENVSGLISWNGGLVFHEVQTDLEAEGYEVWPVVLPAAGVGAPHRRDRVWFIAYSVNGGHSTGRRTESEENRIQGECRKTMDTGKFNGASVSPTTPNPDGLRRPQEHELQQPELHQQYGKDGNAPNTSIKGLQRSKVNGSTGSIGEDGNEQPARCIPPSWDNFPTQPPVCSRNDGIPNRLDGITFSKWRNESIKAYGNAVVPQVVYQIFKTIEAYEQTNQTTIPIHRRV